MSSKSHSMTVGISFGLTSGVITTLGMIVGLHSSTKSKLVVIAGILVIAVSDSLSDAMGIHMSEESENVHTSKEVWIATISTFLSKLFFTLTFLVPFFIFELVTAIYAAIVWGMLLIIGYSLLMGKRQKTKTWKIILEHTVIAALVIVLTHYIGKGIALIG